MAQVVFFRLLDILHCSLVRFIESIIMVSGSFARVLKLMCKSFHRDFRLLDVLDTGFFEDY